MYFHSNNFFSKYQFEFRLGHSSQNCLLLKLEKWSTTCADDGQTGESMLTDLSKVFNYINHDLLIPKLTTYGLFMNLSILFK